MFQRTNTIVFCIYSLFASATIARHVHLKHRHAPRSEITSSAIAVDDKVEPQQLLTSTTLAAPSPSFTAADAVLDDLHNIQTGLNDLPEDLLAIISDLEHRLSDIEKFLAGYLENSPELPTGSPVGPIGPVLSPAPPPAPVSSPTAPKPTSSEPTGTITVTIQSDHPPATTSPPPIITSSTSAEQGTTISHMITRSTRITRTITGVTTVRAPLPTGIIVGNGNNGTLAAVNGTGSGFAAPAPWTRPYLASGFSSVVMGASSVEAVAAVQTS
jgi:hypothetical protein